MTLKVPDEPPPAAPAPVARRAMSGADGVLVPESDTIRGCSEVMMRRGGRCWVGEGVGGREDDGGWWSEGREGQDGADELDLVG